MIFPKRKTHFFYALQAFIICSLLIGCASPASHTTNVPSTSDIPSIIPSPVVSQSEVIPSPAVFPCSENQAKSLSGRQLPESSVEMNSGAFETNTPEPVQGLQNALQMADSEMKSASQSVNLQEARQHAEAVVNILVGYWGCWYGDANGDGRLDDPSDGYGVLPAGRIQEAAPDTPADRIQLGWALDVYDKGEKGNQKLIQAILGNVKLWQTDPSSAYAAIQSAVTSNSQDHVQIKKLQGNVDRAVAWARLILISAKTLDEAKDFARNGQTEINAAVLAAGQIR
jgi:hypothetical protein